MQIRQFHDMVVKDYEASLDVFFDPDTGGVLEPGREDGAPRFLFTEVTGYALLDFLLLHSLTGDKQYIDRVVKSANWIRDHGQDATGGVLTRYYFDHDDDPSLAFTSFAGRRIYAFDTGICLRGMVAAYRATNDASYLASARRMADFMIERMMEPSGRMHAIFDAKNDGPVPADANVWSRAFSAFLTKVAEALVDLQEVTGESRYTQAAIAICDAGLAYQHQSGLIETSTGRCELHPHCYATEGYLHVGRKTGEQRFIDAARRATEWALKQCVDGEIAQSFEAATGKPLSRFRTDALSQVLALGADLLQIGQLDPALEPRLHDLAARVLSMKQGTPPYFRYGFYERPFNGKHEADTRSYWTNMFCLRGLHRYYVSHLVRNTYVTILAGGIGSRLWPISCENRPKPVSMSLLGDRSLLQETIRRFRHDMLIPAERIYIFCARSAVEQATAQAAMEGVPPGNCVIEPEPKGTIPAVQLACAGLPAGNDAEDERLIIVSMADNVIEPYTKFQAAIVSALITARENATLVSIGRPVSAETPRDGRFGHMKYTRSIDGSRSYEVSRFVEKPDEPAYEQLASAPGRLAWESGCVIFRESYFDAVVPPTLERGNLAEHLLSRAQPWNASDAQGVRVATAVMDSGTRFEDFGVPGRNMLSYFRGHPQYDVGHGNICAGNPDKVRLVACADNLVIADELPIDLYGVKGFVVIDNAVTNTTVVLKIEDVAHLPNLYRLFQGSSGYEAFIAGGKMALTAKPTTFVERSPGAHAVSDYGLVFAYSFTEKLRIERTITGVRILNENLPELSMGDFEVLSAKQSRDPRLVEHLVNVGSLARALTEQDLSLSATGRDILNKVSLYHAMGGTLSQEGEGKEAEALRTFRSISALDLQLLDARVVKQLLVSSRDMGSGDLEEMVDLLNINVTSAVHFLRRSGGIHKTVRDLVVGLLQVQDSPALFRVFRSQLEKMGYAELAPDVEKIHGAMKIAQILNNGRWLWKRSAHQDGVLGRPWALTTQRGPVEEFAFILTFCIRTLDAAGIVPDPYAMRLLSLFRDPHSSLCMAMQRLQENAATPVCDVILRKLLTPESAEETLSAWLGDILASVPRNPGTEYEWVQLFELPENLRRIAACSGMLDSHAIAVVEECILDYYHAHWRDLNPARQQASVTMR
ncbi:MAG: hypothetical protein H6993_00380 [Pseudomonadales bacterium]|nr:hypothetical protein [Pseudomonadales bacterium]